LCKLIFLKARGCCHSFSLSTLSPYLTLRNHRQCVGESDVASSAADLVKKAVEMRESGRIDEAIIAARRATTVDPEDANTWWQLGQAVAEKDGAAAAITHFKKTVELANSFAYGWHRLGAAYKKTGMLDEAIASWETAIENDEDLIDTLNTLANAYRQRELRDDEEKLFGILKLLESKGKINDTDLNTLGIGYHKKKDYHKAIRCYRKFATTDVSAVGYFNLGLALNSSEISQDADAVDSWLRALGQDPGYDNAQKRLDATMPQLLMLRHRILDKGTELLGPDQKYLNYINPFELLNLTDVVDVFSLEIKTIQKAKKSLLQEIELEDGLVDWVPGLRIDKSQAIKISDGLTDENDRYWHHVIYENKSLLDFMSRGSIQHFLVDEELSPIETLKKIDEWPGEFEALVGESFAAQFDLLLTKAVEKRDVDLIEALLDGRRWVSFEQEDRCFSGAIRKIDEMLKPLRDAAEQSEKIKPSVEAVRTTLANGNLGKIIGMLPTSFLTIQQEAAGLIRSISIDANNHHDDPALAKQIMALGKPLAGRSSSFMLTIEEDTRILDERIEAAEIVKEAERIDHIMEPLRQSAQKSEKLKPRLEGLKEILSYGNLSSTLIALPIPLWHFQEEAASLIRGISINAYNLHGDADLAKDILTLAKSLITRTSELNARLDEDIKTLDDRIRKEREDEAFLTYKGTSYSITRKAVTFGSEKLAVEDVRTLRWGTSVSRSGTVATYTFSFAVGGRGANVLTLIWSSYKDVDAQRALFKKFVDAAFAYLLPRVIEMIQRDLDSNQTIRIGTAPVSRFGISFTIEGWFSNKQEICPWSRLRSEVDNGVAVITDISNKKCKISLPLATVDNSIALHLMINNQSRKVKHASEHDK
jgi:tetratricopeptide (TPR) repeat protein